MHDSIDVFFRITPRAKKSRQLLEVPDGVEVQRSLLGAERAIQIAAQAHMAGVANELAEMIQMIDQSFETQIRGLWRGRSAFPTGRHHPGIERQAHHGSAIDNRMNISSLSWRWCGTRAREL